MHHFLPGILQVEDELLPESQWCAVQAENVTMTIDSHGIDPVFLKLGRGWSFVRFFPAFIALPSLDENPEIFGSGRQKTTFLLG